MRAYEGHRKWQFTPSLLRKARKHVEYLQTTLFRAFKDRWKLREVNRFRRLLKNSYFNKLLSIDKITRLNNGKKTAGIDGVKLKLKTHGQLERLMEDLFKDLNRNKWKPKANRRIEIPKPDGTTRPLGIPTQRDRIVQNVLSTILEPEVEHLIHSHQLNSFGFRKKMSTADAIGCLISYAHKGKHAIAIEADIAKCFDRISHTYILTLLEGNLIQEPVGKLLNAGHWDLETNHVITSEMGTPQGGIISPAISNLVLRTLLDKPFQEYQASTYVAGKNLVTYADDLVMTFSPKTSLTKDSKKLHDWQDTVTKNARNWLTQQLAIAGLELKPSKTRTITDDTPIDFLGYEIQRGKGIRLMPSKVKKFKKAIKDQLTRGKSQKRVIKEINPMLRGLYNYAAKFSSGKMWKQLGKIDLDIAKRCHKLYRKYDIGQVKYTDVPKTVKYLSPPKGATWFEDPKYWESKDLKNLPPRKRTAYRKQQGICPLCRRAMKGDDLLETHHLKPKGKGGKEVNANIRLVHLRCHQRHHESNEIPNLKEVTTWKDTKRLSNSKPL